ncbi:hypothetical protein V1264_020418 [Littorina saxatilis]|uniref:Uncharacterized protein n=1 Tax=Littorina saxatilis TaxID=31220 RepID=A0AAN9GCS8_9CAEN
MAERCWYTRTDDTTLHTPESQHPSLPTPGVQQRHAIGHSDHHNFRFVDCPLGCCWHVEGFCCPVASSDVVSVVVTTVLVIVLVSVLLVLGCVLLCVYRHLLPTHPRRHNLAHTSSQHSSIFSIETVTETESDVRTTRTAVRETV